MAPFETTTTANYEPSRMSSALLLKMNLLDPVLYISTILAYLISYLLANESSTLVFVFSLTYWIFNYHIESYRSFKLVRRSVNKLNRNRKSMQLFLGAHLGHNLSLSYQVDTFRWANKLIASLWPHVSHVVHFKLNEFIKTSRTFSRPTASTTVRLLYAIGRQIDASVVAIEHCQLGAKAPYVKSIKVMVDYESQRGGNGDGWAKIVGKRHRAHSKLRKSRRMTNKLLVYDLSLAYEGNMNISLIYKYLCSCNSRLGLRDVFIHLRSRLAIGTIDEVGPSLERLAFSLLELPEFGYRGIAIVELARLRLVRRSINRLIKEKLLFPKAISLDLEELMSGKGSGRAPNQVATKTVSSRRPIASRIADQDQEQLPLCTRLFAKLLVCSCLCTNCCLSWCNCQCHSESGEVSSSNERSR